jgi:hypothetical protein
MRIDTDVSIFVFVSFDVFDGESVRLRMHSSAMERHKLRRARGGRVHVAAIRADDGTLRTNEAAGRAPKVGAPLEIFTKERFALGSGLRSENDANAQFGHREKIITLCSSSTARRAVASNGSEHEPTVLVAKNGVGELRVVADRKFERSLCDALDGLVRIVCLDGADDDQVIDVVHLHASAINAWR